MQGVRESTPEEQEHIAQVLHLEEARFRRRLAKVEVGRRKMLAVRSNLGRLHRKNAQLMELRCRLQREQWAKENPQSEELQKGRNRTPPRS